MFFSKALFKQSMKANWIKWVAVTVSTCVMLAIVIIVLGNLGINNIRDSLKMIFIQADQEASLKENCIDSYDLYNTTLTNYDQNYVRVGLAENLTNTYDAQISGLGHEATEPEKEAIVNGILAHLPVDDEESKQIAALILNTHKENPTLSGKVIYDNFIISIMGSEAYKQTYDKEIEKGSTEEDATKEAKTSQTTVELIGKTAITQYSSDRVAVEESGNQYTYNWINYQPYSLNLVNQIMKDGARATAIAEGKTAEEAEQFAVSVKVISNTAIGTYQLLINESITPQDAKVEATKSISDQLNETDAKVSLALTELGNMDIYGLIIGSIFYRIAGLLLPMVFVIMTANGLIAGQVDSGSMAYVLSTPTKRRTVTVTQMLYLLAALFSMFSILTVVSVIAVWVVGGNSFAINFGEILLMNLGAFLTMFAIAGYCFMCSAIFNRTKHSMSIGGGLTIFSLVCTILGLFGSEVMPTAMRISQMNFFNYLSIITLFDTNAILAGSLSYLWKFGILFAVGVITFIVGIFRFDKKDLPL